MPDHDLLEPGRRALGEVSAPDLWAEAERRAAAGGMVPLVLEDGRGRHPRRWLAVAAVALLAAGTAGVIASLDDDGDHVDTTPEATDPEGPSIVTGDGCTYGVTGDPIVMQPGPPDPPIFPNTIGEGTVSHANLGGQAVEVRVPGLVVDDLVGERVELIELERGSADVWFGPDFVQVRWFTGSQDQCQSFTVTVTGSTEDGNRHAAVDFAERILLPSDLGPAEQAEAPISEALPGTTWRVVELHRADEAVSLDGVASPDRIFISFSDGEISGGDGCNFFGGPVAFDDDGYVEVGMLWTTYRLCAGPEDRRVQEAMDAVLGADRIAVRPLADGRLELSGGVKDRIILELG